jgi:type IV pilus assembly protein PilN
MPKINLLQQITPETTVSKPSRFSPQITQLIGMSVVVVLGLSVFLIYTGYTVNTQSNRVKQELEEEKRQATELVNLKKQAEELQKKLTLVENRVKIIKQLRAEQRGPVAVLSSINERIPLGISLESITQRSNLMTIVGTTPTESLVAAFAKDLEFSNGLFTGFDVQTELINPNTDQQKTRFTIRCTYNPPVANPNPDAPQTASN